MTSVTLAAPVTPVFGITTTAILLVLIVTAIALDHLRRRK